MKDQVRIASVCLMVTSFMFAGVAWGVYQRHGGVSALAACVVGYALFIYVVMGVLAIDFRRWAWRASVGIFVGNAGVSLFLLNSVAGWSLLLLAGVGLWACFNSGTRAVLVPPLNEAA